MGSGPTSKDYEVQNQGERYKTTQLYWTVGFLSLVTNGWHLPFHGLVQILGAGNSAPEGRPISQQDM